MIRNRRYFRRIGRPEIFTAGKMSVFIITGSSWRNHEEAQRWYVYVWRERIGPNPWKEMRRRRKMERGVQQGPTAPIVWWADAGTGEIAAPRQGHPQCFQHHRASSPFLISLSLSRSLSLSLFLALALSLSLSFSPSLSLFLSLSLSPSLALSLSLSLSLLSSRLKNRKSHKAHRLALLECNLNSQ